MGRNLSQTTIDELSGLEMFPFYALDFTDGTTDYKYTTLDVPQTLTVSGGPSGTYQSRGFEFDSINYTLSNVMDDCSIKIDNIDSVLTSIFVGGNVEEKTASVYVGVMSPSGGVLGTVLLFTGEVDSFEVTETEVRLVIGSIFTRWGHESYSQHPSSCRWKVLGGTECAYSGTETLCDRSYVRCTTLGNTANFGGFKWLPSIENKKFPWGPTMSEAAYIAKH